MKPSPGTRSPVALPNNPNAGARTWALACTAVLVAVWSMTGCNSDVTTPSVAKVTKVDKQPEAKGDAASCCQVSPSEQAKTIARGTPGDQPAKGWWTTLLSGPQGPDETPSKTEPPGPPAQPAEPEDKSVYKLPPVREGAKRKEMAPNVFFETEGPKAEKRRMVIVAEVCLRQSQYRLEGLLTKAKGKEHEYILSIDADAELMHKLLMVARAEPGSPVKFDPKYSPACGTPIKLTVRYLKDGKLISIPAQQWIRDVKTGKDLAQDWVFGGSRYEPNVDDPKKPIYTANWGDIICVTNMESAMLDLPVPERQASGIENRNYEAHTERIPPIGTKVELVFEPVLEKK